MKITDLIKRDTIILDLKARKKEDVLKELIEKLDKSNKLYDKEEFKREIFKREAEGTTGIGDGIAIPHAKTKAVKTPSIALGRSKPGVEFDSLDGNKAKLFFMIAASENANMEHLEILSQLARFLMDKNFSKKLLQANTIEEIIKIIDDKEIEENNKLDKKLKKGQNKKILAVTSCPIGIAHTYMAADALKAKAYEMGVDIKVETNGSMGVKNLLTEKDIKEAKAIIVSTDTKVWMDRFDGKRVIHTKVSDAIKDPESLIKRALEDREDIYIYSQKTAYSNKIHGKDIYDSLMNGVSNMLPFIVCGGILIALASLFDFNSIAAEAYGYANSIAIFLNTLGSIAFDFVFPVLGGYIAFSIGDRIALAPGFIGGALSSNSDAGFIGALIAGLLAGYIMIGLKKILERLPNSLEGIKSVLIYPLFGTLAVGLIMSFIIIPPVETLNMGLNMFLNRLGRVSKVFLGILLAGMMAVDMGGPINKLAYVFGLASVAEGNGHIMAAVMAGGMVPPLGIAVATTFFKEKFTKDEIDVGKTNYIMGLSFITEGAIAFAVEDPKAVIPSLVVGSALAGGLSEFFGVSSPVAHGGIFVLPLVTNGLLYLISILIGSIVTAILLKILKKDIDII